MFHTQKPLSQGPRAARSLPSDTVDGCAVGRASPDPRPPEAQRQAPRRPALLLGEHGPACAPQACRRHSRAIASPPEALPDLFPEPPTDQDQLATRQGMRTPSRLEDKRASSIHTCPPFPRSSQGPHSCGAGLRKLPVSVEGGENVPDAARSFSAALPPFAGQPHGLSQQSYGHLADSAFGLGSRS